MTKGTVLSGTNVTKGTVLPGTNVTKGTVLPGTFCMTKGTVLSGTNMTKGTMRTVLSGASPIAKNQKLKVKKRDDSSRLMTEPEGTVPFSLLNYTFPLFH